MTSVNSNFFQTAVQGLDYAQSALNITSSNISNSADPSYTRELAVKLESSGSGAGSVVIGERQTSFYLNQNVLAAQSYSSGQTTYSGLADQLNQLLASTSVTGSTSATPSDIGGAIQSFFTSVNALATAPEDSAARQAVISNAGIVSSEFSNIGTQFTNMANNVSQNITGDVQSINSLASQIATVNQQLQQYQGASLSEPPNTLLDQRDSLLQSLSKIVQISVLPQSDGTYSVFMGMGQPLVLGGNSEPITTIPSKTTPGTVDLAYTSATGETTIPSNEILGGDLGTLLQFRAQTLEPAAQQLGLLANTFAVAVNQQLSLGRDLQGNAGAPIFQLPLLPSTPVTVNNPPAGSLTTTLVDPSQAQASDYQLKKTGDDAYTVTRLSDGTSATLPDANGGDVFDGLQFNPTGMSIGDTFIVQPYTSTMGGIKVGMTDPSLLAAASGPIGVTSGTANTGSGSLSVVRLSNSSSTFAPGNFSTSNFLPSSSPEQYTVSITKNSDGGFNYTVSPAPTGGGSGTVASDNTISLTNGTGAAAASLTLRLDGNVQSGDTFTLGAANFGAGDVTNSTALYNLQASNTLLNGQTSFNNLYSSITSNIGLVGSQYQATSAAASGVLQSATNALQQISGVNLDEEAGNLLSEEQQYQAAAKVISVATQLFQSILQI